MQFSVNIESNITGNALVLPVRLKKHGDTKPALSPCPISKQKKKRINGLSFIVSVKANTTYNVCIAKSKYKLQFSIRINVDF